MTFTKLARAILPSLVALALGAPALSGAASAKEWTHVRIATEGAYPPYNFHEAGGKLAGFEIDLVADLCKRMHVECEVVAQDWDGILPGLNAGKYDAIMAAMSITPKRLEVINFTAPYVSSPTILATNRNSGLEGLPGEGMRVNLSDDAAAKAMVEKLAPKLKGKAVGVQVSTIQADLLNQYFKDVVQVRTYKTTEELTLDLGTGRIDAMCASAAVIQAAKDAPDGADIVFTGPAFTGGPTGIGSGIGLRKADTDLKAMFDDAIKASMADGTLAQLSMKWFKLDLTPR